MSMTSQVMVVVAVCIATMMLLLWVLSLALKNASIVDIAWGAGFVMVGWVSFAVGKNHSNVGLLLALLATIWGLRLAGYLAWRNTGHGEDFRYRAMRKHYGSKFSLVSLYSVFALQGVLMWVVSLPLQLGQGPRNSSLGALVALGSIVWLVGIVFESVGDVQLARFKGDAANAGKVMQTGLWRYTRHPNYFGDCLVWWGLALIAAESSYGYFGFIGAVVMTVLLLKYSGVALLEKTISRRRPEYAEYQAKTSAFIPRPPKR